MIVVCIQCGRDFRAKHKNRTLCSARCRRKRRAEYRREYQRRPDWRAYKTEWQARRRLDPAYRERERAQQAEYRERLRGGRHG